MITIRSPRYSPNQKVSFIGGVGKVLCLQPTSGTWTYAIELEMGEPPEVGRLGAETTILLYETEINGVMSS
ncbi:hypothetical protein QUB80_01350 [Chlorogloeopsis sp. ULAP01]|uniref:hypothetical protein n=1 Tax=Chlorogloeopsis sp. ULAP01 TaxID=3056483 RepID=UPI0025AAEF82|nr:hypothetical protein [Chlorogloeopsis sp. ULAP01]MDM9379354.1 hypothetical protein [Chlorogloeopsis sp. ULAP01]